MKQGRILQVEDDDNDVFFLTVAVEDAGITNPIDVARDGQQAIDYFKSALAQAYDVAAALPCLVLLDVKLPVIKGTDVLRWIRQQPLLDKMAVLMVSASDEPSDLEVSYECGANSYFIKPCNLNGRIAFARQLKSWILGEGDLPCSSAWHAKYINAGVGHQAKQPALEPRMEAKG